MVCPSVEETLKTLLDAEVKQICGTQRRERPAERVNARVGYYERKLERKAEAVTLRMPKLTRLAFLTAMIERSKLRGCSPEEAFLELYIASYPCSESETSPKHSGAPG